MRVGQPGVQRKERHLDGEGQGERAKQNRLRVRGKAQAVEVSDGEAPHAGLVELKEAEIDDAQQHQERAGDGEEEELDRRVDAVRPAPHADDQVHRQQRQLEEDVEEDEISGHEHADHRRFHDQEGDDVLLRMLVDRIP